MKGDSKVKAPLAIIRGDDKEKAPRPTRRSIVRVLYDVVDAIGGDGATEDEIMQMLPAAIDDDSIRSLLTPDRLHGNLRTQVTHGYFLHVPGNEDKGIPERFRIAPRSYYEARRQALAQRREELDADETRAVRSRHVVLRPGLPDAVVVYKANPLLLFGVAMAAFFAGMIVGKFLL